MPRPEAPGIENSREPRLVALLRREASAAFAAVYHSFGDFELAEDARQEAMVSAWENWRSQGLPDSPAAWLAGVAKRKAIDMIRKRSTQNRIAQAVAKEPGAGCLYREPELDEESPEDLKLRLLFLCCHPALGADAQIGLMLKEVSGLSVPEIGALTLTAPPAVYQRLQRAKKKIRLSGIAMSMPTPEEIRERVHSVMRAMYLLFTHGHRKAAGPDLYDPELCDEAIYLGDELCRLVEAQNTRRSGQLPHAEALGLSALFRLHDARRLARLSQEGELLVLAEQNRRLWDQEKIREGNTLLDRALVLRDPGPYQIQAAIAALHAEALDHNHTDWRQIRLLYDRLLALTPGPVIRLNRAVALGMEQGADRGLEALEPLGENGELDTYGPFHAARAEFLSRCARQDEAQAAWRKALELASNDPERAYIRLKLLQ